MEMILKFLWRGSSEIKELNKLLDKNGNGYGYGVGLDIVPYLEIDNKIEPLCQSIRVDLARSEQNLVYFIFI